MNDNLTDNLVESLYELAKKEIPENIVIQIKKSILDYIGNNLAGAKIAMEKSNAYLDLFEPEQGVATVIGLNRKASLHNAVFANGYNAHITELDDGHRFSMVHLASTIIPAVLAVVEKEKLTGNDLLRGVIIGYEAAIRLGMAVQPSHKNLGFHVSGTCGTIGAAIGIAAALNLSKEQMKSTLSAAIASAAGVLEMIEDESELKPYNIGRAAHDGLTAAFVGRAGYKGPYDAVNGKRGFFALMSAKSDLTKLKGDGGYGIEKTYKKPYAACRHCHAPIEAVLNIKAKFNIDVANIKEVTVKTYSLAVFGHDHAEVSGVTSAKMSTPYSVAVALVIGKAGIEEFLDDCINNKKIYSTSKKVKVLEDEELTKLVPDKRAAIVEIITNNGQRYEERVNYPKGEPENPMTKSDVEEKFISLAMYGGKTEEEAKTIIQKVWNIENKLPELFTEL